MSTSVSEEPTIISACCVKGIIMSGTPTGSMQSMSNVVPYYLAGSEFEGKSNGKVIVVAADVFGIGVKNPKLIADALSQSTKFPVYVPDLLEGDHPSPDGLTMLDTPIGHLSFLTRTVKMAKVFSGFVTKIGPLFLYKHRPGVIVPLADQFCAALRTEKGATRIGMVGYCMGGTVTTKLAASTFDSVDVLVTAHPGQVSVDDFKVLNKPYALICSQEDFSFDSVKPAALIVLEQKKAEGIPVAIYEHPGTTHGFAARSSETPSIKLAFEKALEQTKDWFLEYL